MKIHKAFKVRLTVSDADVVRLTNHATLARYVWNWGLDTSMRYYAEFGKGLHKYALGKMWTARKQKLLTLRIGPPDAPVEVPLYDLSSETPFAAIHDLDEAYKHFFRRVKAGETPGFPRFKPHHERKSFRVRKGIKVYHNKAYLGKAGWVQLKEHGYIPVTGARYLFATVSERNGKWYLSVTCEVENDKEAAPRDTTLAVHHGLRHFVTLSNGVRLDNPRALKTAMRRLRIRQRHADKCKPTPGHKANRRYRERMAKVAATHEKITNRRANFTHELTSEMARDFATVLTEQWKVKDMMSTKRRDKSEPRFVQRARNLAIADAAWSEVRRQLDYKLIWRGGTLIEAPINFPSTRKCSACGFVNDALPLSVKYLRCAKCSAKIEREDNAIRNLEALFDKGEMEKAYEYSVDRANQV